MEVIKKYTLPVTDFTYYVVKHKNGKVYTYGKKAYEELVKKEKG